MANKKQKNTDNKEMMSEKEQTAQEAQATENTPVESGDTAAPQEEANAEQRLTAELAAMNDKYLRLYAEFDNYKRRVSKERIEFMQTAGKDIIVSLLPLVDDFERALKAMETATEVATVKEGINLVSHKLKTILSHQGLKEMESIGKPFDAELQEAITNVPAPSDELKGKVIDEIEKGYYLHDKVIRHAKVVVGN